MHKYYITEHARDGLEVESADEHKSNDAVKGLVSVLCERLCSVFGSSAVLSAANTIRFVRFLDLTISLIFPSILSFFFYIFDFFWCFIMHAT